MKKLLSIAGVVAIITAIIGTIAAHCRKSVGSMDCNHQP